MEQREEEKTALEKKKRQAKQKLEELKKKQETGVENVDDELKKLQLEQQEIEEHEKKVAQEEKSAPWNVDTISKEGWSKTLFNKPVPREDRSKLSDEELEQRYKQFVKKHESKIKEYAMISKFEDCKQYLMQNQDLGNLSLLDEFT